MLPYLSFFAYKDHDDDGDADGNKEWLSYLDGGIDTRLLLGLDDADASNEVLMKVKVACDGLGAKAVAKVPDADAPRSGSKRDRAKDIMTSWYLFVFQWETLASIDLLFLQRSEYWRVSNACR